MGFIPMPTEGSQNKEEREGRIIEGREVSRLAEASQIAEESRASRGVLYILGTGLL